SADPNECDVSVLRYGKIHRGASGREDHACPWNGHPAVGEAAFPKQRSDLVDRRICQVGALGITAIRRFYVIVRPDRTRPEGWLVEMGGDDGTVLAVVAALLELLDSP